YVFCSRASMRALCPASLDKVPECITLYLVWSCWPISLGDIVNDGGLGFMLGERWFSCKDLNSLRTSSQMKQRSNLQDCTCKCIDIPPFLVWVLESGIVGQHYLRGQPPDGTLKHGRSFMQCVSFKSGS